MAGASESNMFRSMTCTPHPNREQEADMARGLNRALLIGNLGGDPEIKYAPSGTAIATFNLATNKNRKNQSGEWEESTEWHKIVMFGRQAETCKDYLRKGSKIYLEGRIQTRSWDDKQSGQKRYMTEIVGSNMLMLDSRGQDGGSAGPSMKAPPANDFPEGDDDLPF